MLFAVSLWPNLTSHWELKTALDNLNYKEGYVTYMKEGVLANICVNDDIEESILRKVGKLICKNNFYQ